MPRSGKCSNLTLAIAAGGCLAAMAAVIVATLARGFDITDEGFALLISDRPSLYPGAFLFHFVANTLLQGEAGGGLGARVWSLSLNIAGSTLLGAAALPLVYGRALHRDDLLHGFAFLCFGAIGGLLSYAYKVNTLNYNDLACFAIEVAVAGAFMSVRSTDTAITLRLTGLLFVAIGLMLEALTKPASAVLLALMLLAFGLTAAPARRVALAALLCLALVVSGLWAAQSLFIQLTGAGGFDDVLAASQRVTQLPGYRLVDQLKMVAVWTGTVLLILLSFVGAHRFGESSAAIRASIPDAGKRTAFAVFVSLVIVSVMQRSVPFRLADWFGFSYLNCWYCYNPAGVSMHFVVCLLAMVLYCIVRSPQSAGRFLLGAVLQRAWGRRSVIGPIVLLAFVPYAGIAGTNGGFVLPMAMFAAFWFVLIASALASPHQRVRACGRAAFLVCAVLSFLQVAETRLFWPARVLHDAGFYSVPLAHDGYAKGIFVSPDFRRAVSRVKELIAQRTQFAQGAPVVAMYDMPGMVYLLGGTSPGVAWYSPEFYRVEHACDMLARARPQLENALVLVSEIPGHDILQCLKDRGLDFPGSYTALGTVEMPAGEFLRPFRAVHVWAPRALLKVPPG